VYVLGSGVLKDEDAEEAVLVHDGKAEKRHAAMPLRS